MKVVKFGGSSLAAAPQVRQVCGIVRADAERRIIVVSAPGKRRDREDDTKVTDLLIACAEERIRGGDACAELEAVIARYEEIREGLGLAEGVTVEIAEDLRGRLAEAPAPAEAFTDAMKAGGEDNAARLVAAALRAEGVDARYVSPAEAGLLLSDEAGNAQVLAESYDNLARLRGDGVVVFPGFFGHTREGRVVTFPRGGSDITGAILAKGVRADLYENFTDVDAVCAVDPRIVPGARPIPMLTFREMRELSYAGFGVFQDEALVPVIEAEIPVCIKNTGRPEAPGTLIVPEREMTGEGAIGVAGKAGFCSLFVGKYLMNRERGFGRRLLQIIEEEGLNYEHAPTGIDDISLILREEEIDAGMEARLIARVRSELDADVVTLVRGMALVMVVGEGWRDTPGLAMKATGALGRARINIEMMNQGSSAISMIFGIRAGHLQDAITVLYRAFFEDT